MKRITNVVFDSERFIAITSTEDGLEHTCQLYDLKDNWACGVVTAWHDEEPFESWVFESNKDYEDYMRGYNEVKKQHKVN